MRTSFKKAIKCFLESVLGISYLTHKGYLSVFILGGWHGGSLARGFHVQEVYVLIPQM